MSVCPSVCRCLCSHGVPVADVFAGGLDDRLTGLVQGPVDAVVGPGVGRLDQVLELWEPRPFSVSDTLQFTKQITGGPVSPVLHSMCEENRMLVLNSMIFLL